MCYSSAQYFLFEKETFRFSTEKDSTFNAWAHSASSFDEVFLEIFRSLKMMLLKQDMAVIKSRKLNIEKVV